jgi:hypothetical protein
MLLTHKIRHTAFTTSVCFILLRLFCQPQNAGPSLMPHSIRSTLQYKLPQKNENEYIELQFISILAQSSRNNLNFHCYHAIKIIENIKQIVYIQNKHKQFL